MACELYFCKAIEKKRVWGEEKELHCWKKKIMIVKVI